MLAGVIYGNSQVLAPVKLATSQHNALFPMRLESIYVKGGIMNDTTKPSFLIIASTGMLSASRDGNPTSDQNLTLYVYDNPASAIQRNFRVMKTPKAGRAT